MPIYEYRCPACADLFEKRASFSENSRETDCPGCGAQASKLLSTFAAIGSAGGSAAGASMAPSGPMAGGGCCGGGACGAQ